MERFALSWIKINRIVQRLIPEYVHFHTSSKNFQRVFFMVIYKIRIYNTYRFVSRMNVAKQFLKIFVRPIGFVRDRIKLFLWDSLLYAEHNNRSSFKWYCGIFHMK